MEKSSEQIFPNCRVICKGISLCETKTQCFSFQPTRNTCLVDKRGSSFEFGYHWNVKLLYLNAFCIEAKKWKNTYSKESTNEKKHMDVLLLKEISMYCIWMTVYGIGAKIYIDINIHTFFTQTWAHLHQLMQCTHHRTNKNKSKSQHKNHHTNIYTRTHRSVDFLRWMVVVKSEFFFAAVKFNFL